MVHLLWQREVDGKVFDSPERKAALDKTLREKIRLIRDPSIRSHYGQEIKNLRWELFRNRPTARAKSTWKGGKDKPMPPLVGTKSSFLGAAGSAAQDHLREAVILASALATPQIILEFEAGLEAMSCADPDHARLRDLILRHATDAPETFLSTISGVLGSEALENMTSLRHVAISPCVRNPGDVEIARMTLAEELAKLESRRGLSAEIAEAAEELSGVADEAMTWRLGQAAQAHNKAERSEHEDKAEYDIGDNGARIKRDERSAFDALVDQIKYAKPRR
jgi:DNA primase